MTCWKLPTTAGREQDENRVQRQQKQLALQTLHGVRAAHELAQSLGKKLGIGALLLRRLPRQEEHCAVYGQRKLSHHEQL